MDEEAVAFTELGLLPQYMSLSGPNRVFFNVHTGGLGWAIPAAIKSPLLRALKRWNRRRRRGSFKTHPSMDVPLAPKEIIEHAIVVYPETRSGNPLQSSRVARWMLHKHGFFGVDAKIGPNEEIFYFHAAYVEDFKKIPNDRILTVGYFNEYMYKNLGHPR